MNSAIIDLCKTYGIKCIEGCSFVNWFNMKHNENDNEIENLTYFVNDKVHPASGTEEQALESVNILANLYYPIIRDFR